MEVLSETTHWGGFIFLLILSGGVAFLFIIATISNIFDREVGGAIVTALMGALWSALFTLAIVDGPLVSYKATITDFNEVYENGYVITDKDGDLWTLEKAEGDD